MAHRKARLEILFENEQFLVANKPAGILSIPDRYDVTAPTVASVLGRPECLPVHRLDRDTSGVIVFALNEDAHRSLNDQFSNRSVRKVYHALVLGEPRDEVFEIELPIAVDQGRSHLSLVSAQGKPAQTSCSVVRRLGPYSLIEAVPRTGRTHQIRVHLTSYGLPIVADPLYGNAPEFFLSTVKRSYSPGKSDERPLMGRLGLHALSIQFTDPTSGESRDFDAPYAKDFRASVTQLQKLFG